MRTDKFGCTQDTSWKAVQSSLFPRMISLLSYGMACWICWVFWCPLSSRKISKYVIPPVAISFIATIGMLAIIDASADVWDVISGYVLGILVAGIVMGILPNLFPILYEIELPYYWNDRMYDMYPLAHGRLGPDPNLEKPSEPAKFTSFQ